MLIEFSVKLLHLMFAVTAVVKRSDVPVKWQSIAYGFSSCYVSILSSVKGATESPQSRVVLHSQCHEYCINTFPPYAVEVPWLLLQVHSASSLRVACHVSCRQQQVYNMDKHIIDK